MTGVRKDDSAPDAAPREKSAKQIDLDRRLAGSQNAGHIHSKIRAKSQRRVRVISQPPVRAALDTEIRPEVGGYRPDSASTMLDRLRSDVKDVGVRHILQSYERRVLDRQRRRSARRVLANFVKNKFAGRADDIEDLIEVLYFGGYQRLLAKHKIVFPAYDINEEYFLNTTQPWGPTILPRPAVQGRNWEFLGRDIGFPIGVSASVLTPNAAWVSYWARCGYNVITYKTVRSREASALELPNWTFVKDFGRPISPQEDPEFILSITSNWTDFSPLRGRDITTANSFGVPCAPVDDWQADVSVALSHMSHGQVMIVSVMGDFYAGDELTPEALAKDYAHVTMLAVDAGASIIELNLSCPNNLLEGEVKEPICNDAVLTRLILSTVRQTLDQAGRESVQLVLKLSWMPYERLEHLLGECLGMFEAIAGINTLQVAVSSSDGTETFPGRSLAGLSGIAIRDYARDFARSAVRARFRLQARFDIVGIGGVSDADSFNDLYLEGCAVVQAATGTFANPWLARDCVAGLGRDLPTYHPLPHDLLDELVDIVFGVMGEPGVDFVDEVLLCSILPWVSLDDIHKVLKRIGDRPEVKVTDDSVAERFARQ